MQEPSLTCLLLLTLLTACNSTTIIPGSTLKTRNKTVAYTGNETAADADISKHVAIYPIAPGLIARMKEPPVTARKNDALTREKANYVHRIGSGDVSNVAVWNHNNLNSLTQQNNPQTNQASKGVWVDGRGNITYPLAGQIQAKGRTTEELQNILADRPRRYLKNPQVVINVTESRSQRISVVGAVTQAGQQPITSVPLTILDAVNQAGGATAEADTQNIKRTHNGADCTISLQELIQYGDPTQNHMLSYSDIVYAPSNSNSKISVMGEAGRQAALPLGSHGLALTRVLGEAGGMNQSIVDATGVLVICKVSDNVQRPIHVYQLNLRDATVYAMGNESSLHANDVVYVTVALVACRNRVVFQLINSITNVNLLDSTFHQRRADTLIQYVFS